MPGSTRLDQALLKETLAIVLDRLLPDLSQQNYCLVGTAAALLHGVQLPARDIDLLLKERSGVDHFSQVLASFECLAPPMFIAESKQYYAAYQVNGVEVEASTVEVATASAYIETFGAGPWTHFHLLACGSYTVPAIALEIRLATELMLNRADRATPIMEWLKRHGCDVKLLSKAMAARRLPRGRIQAVLDQLSRQK